MLIALFVAGLRASSGQAAPAPARVAAAQHGLAQSIHGLDEMVDTYERAELLDEALENIPIEQLSDKARTLVEAQAVPGYEDGLAEALVKWFKEDYFKWADPIKCPTCSGKTKMRGMGQPTPEELRGGAGRVEVHACDEGIGCQGVYRFPRYNDLRALMKSRVGRCGEFANLFSLFLRAVGLRARYVWNAEDHVWNEYWSPSLKRWVHLDSCERVRDEPLLYDRGWGKKMSYILAFSVDGAQDVSRGYIQDWQQALQRRRQGSEEGLRKLLADVTRRRRTGLSADRLKELEQEDQVEEKWLSETEERSKQHNEVDGQGRQSGPEEWVKARGEDGAGGCQ